MGDLRGGLSKVRGVGDLGWIKGRGVGDLGWIKERGG